MRESEWQSKCLRAQARIDQMQALLMDGAKLMDEVRTLLLDLVDAIQKHQSGHPKSTATKADRDLWEILAGMRDSGWCPKSGKGVDRKK